MTDKVRYKEKATLPVGRAALESFCCLNAPDKERSPEASQFGTQKHLPRNSQPGNVRTGQIRWGKDRDRCGSQCSAALRADRAATSALRPSTDSHPSRFHYYEGILQPDAQLSCRFHYRRGLGAACTTMELYEDNACGLVPARVHQLAEVAVLRDEHTPFAQRPLHHSFVDRTFGNFGNREHVVVSLAQCKDYGSRAALVS